jgi:uncharacterized Zn finger protein
MSYGYGYGYAPYVSVREKQEKAQKQLAKMRKKNPNIKPVVIVDKKITTTWWGKSWCDNFKLYAEFQNRIQRGAAYCKNGFVLDLQIAEGEVSAQVQGSKLYQVNIQIKKLAHAKWERIVNACAQKVESIAVLAEGSFPKELSSVFMRQGEGLFPTPGDIKYTCSCPDQYGTHICKHIAAALYGIGNRLDEDPLLLFTLRGVDASQLIRKSVEEKMKSLLANAKKPSKRIIADDDAVRIFQI